MNKKLDMVLGGVQLLVAIGVSTLVGGAIALVKPNNLGAIKKIAVGVGGFVISNMAVNGVNTYVDKKVTETVEQIKGLFKEPEEETVEEEEA